MTLAFEIAVQALLGLEGAHNVDEGGDTVYGIARNFHLDEPWPPSRDRAIEIYRQEYWYRFHCDKLPPPLGIALFDGVVNQGNYAVLCLQSALGIVAPDGVVGPETVRACEGKNLREVNALYMAYRAVRYASNPPSERLGLEARIFRMTWSISELLATGQIKGDLSRSPHVEEA